MGTLVEVRRDGKLYPPHRRTAAEVAAIRALEHGLHCAQHLSIRAVQSALLSQHGIRRSIGMIHRDLAWGCPYCMPQPPKPPDPAQRARVIPWR